MAIDTTQDWTAAYKELCTLIKAKVTEVTHMDLWYQQIDFERKDYPFPMHAVFIDFNTDTIESRGNLAQEISCQIGFYHVFNTLSDTFDTATNQNTAFEFLPVIRKINNALHGTSGTNFSKLYRTSLKRFTNTEPYLVCYYQTYNCVIMDYSACKQYDESQTLTEAGVTLEVDKITTPPTGDDTQLNYEVEM
jgi:hypothetical protein